MKINNHIQCTSDDISELVLLPGDPGRAKYIAERYLEGGKLIAQDREFASYTGEYQGQRITVTSTGIGCPSTAIAVEELISLGAKVLIRVGTCGGALRKDIAPGSIIIPSACIREEGTTLEYVDARFPAVADFKIVQALQCAAAGKKFPYYVGINRTHDAFYGNAKNIKRWAEYFVQNELSSSNIISSEMEAAALFVIASLRGVKAGAVLAVNANPEDLIEIATGQQSFVNPSIKIDSSEARQATDRAIVTALEALNTGSADLQVGTHNS